MKHTKMKELPHEERPYERCVKSGPEYLSDAQLLAVILRPVPARRRAYWNWPAGSWSLEVPEKEFWDFYICPCRSL